MNIRICPPLQGLGPGRARRGHVPDQVPAPARASAVAAGGRGAGGRGRSLAAPRPGGGGARRGTEQLAAAGVRLREGCPLLRGRG